MPHAAHSPPSGSRPCPAWLLPLHPSPWFKVNPPLPSLSTPPSPSSTPRPQVLDKGAAGVSGPQKPELEVSMQLVRVAVSGASERAGGGEGGRGRGREGEGGGEGGRRREGEGEGGRGGERAREGAGEGEGGSLIR